MAEELRYQSLAIGITRQMPGWSILLSQIGISGRNVLWNMLQPEHYAAVIVSDDPSRSEREALEGYLRAGGAILDAGGFLESLEPERFARARLGTIYGSADEPVFTASRIIDIGRSGRVHDRAEHLGRRIYLGEHGGGFIAQLPFDPDALVRESGSRRRQFHSPGRALPDEVVSEVSKGEIGYIVERSLQWLLAQRSLPFLQLWRFPGRARSIFSFRIDSDYGTARELTDLHRTASAYGIRPSWFIHVEPQQGMLDLFRSFEGDELALHAWRHRTFDSYETNAANIAEANAVLRAAGIEPRGFAAPLGRWNPGLARAVEEEGFEYSSEFALDYDDLPFLPWNVWRQSSVLQIPIHPVSIGNFIRVKASDAEMIAYYNAVIDRKLAAAEPVILYGHPGHGRLEVIDAIFRRMSREDVPNMTMGEYAQWWRSRLDTRFDAIIENGRIVVTSERRDRRTFIRAIAPDGTIAFLDNDGAHDIDSIAWGIAPAPTAAPADLRRARAFSLRLLRHAIEDFNSIIRQ
jgi:peptidoglycan/xylan/chitin deacetylase (PgdA/CDA1 family)